MIRVIVLNRLCDPDSKLGAPRWLETVAPPEVDAPTITHQQLLRPMIDQDLSEVFYDLTTIRTERLTSLTDDVLEFGMARKG